MYEVRWTHPAVADLQTKVRTGLVRRYLFAVARSALNRRPDDWGGRLDNGFWWRRGITPQDEADPGAISGGDAGDGHSEMPYEYVLVYLRSVAAPASRPVVVLGVVTNGELMAGPAALFGDGRAAHWSPPSGLHHGPPHGQPHAPPGRRRATRRRGGGA
jgi:hypothetical protein